MHVDRSLETKMLQQTAKAVENADVVLFLIDGKTGVLDEDSHFARCGC